MNNNMERNWKALANGIQEYKYNLSLSEQSRDYKNLENINKIKKNTLIPKRNV